MNLIIIDDEQVICSGLSKMIEANDWGWNVAGVFTDPEEALEVCDWDNIHCVLMDINMPAIDGLSMAHLLNERNFETDIIFITAYSSFEFAQKAIDERPLAYLLKPISREHLRSSLEKARISYEKRISAADNPENIRKNLDTLRKSLFSDLVFRERDFDQSELDRLVGLYELKGMRYAFYELISTSARQAMKSSLDSLCGERIHWYLYGHDYFYAVLFMYQDADIDVEAIVGGIDSHFYIGESGIEDIKELPQYYEKYLGRVRKHYVRTATKPEDESSIIHNFDELSLPIKQTIDYINSNLEKPLSLQSLAVEVFLHPTYLSNLFKKQTGYNLKNYINACRIRKAKDLLNEPSVRVSWVMEQVGFPNRRYFEKVFKDLVGITPTQYKQDAFLRQITDDTSDMS